jgi:hypothetical protein
MHINLVLIPLIIIMGLILPDTRKNRLFYLVFIGAVLLFVAAMRHPEFMEDTYGIDTLNYKMDFLNIREQGWSEILSSVHQRYIERVLDYDYGYQVFSKLFSYLTHDFHIFSLIADLFVFVPLGLILYRYTTSIRQLMFAFVFYIALVQMFFLGGARQMFALGFDLMALVALIDKKKLLMLIFVLFAIFLHFSSILFLLPLLMIWFNISPRVLKTLHIVCFVLFPIVYFYPNEVIRFMGNLMEMEKYANYGEGAITGGANTFIILIELLSLFSMIAIKRKDMQSNTNIRFFYVFLPLITFFAPLINADGTMIRVSLYYYIFLMILVPYSLDYMFDKKSQSLVYTVVIGVLSLLTLSDGGISYYFYWQQI